MSSTTAARRRRFLLAASFLAPVTALGISAAHAQQTAAADQLQSWASRVGAQVVRGPEGADPASVAFDAVDAGGLDAADRSARNPRTLRAHGGAPGNEP